MDEEAAQIAGDDFPWYHSCICKVIACLTAICVALLVWLYAQAAAEVCPSTLMSEFNKSYQFEIPENGAILELFPASSMEYISSPEEASTDDMTCTQFFSYRMKDNSLNPPQLSIDKFTGVFRLFNYATIKTVYEVEIDIIMTDGTNDVLYTV